MTEGAAMDALGVGLRRVIIIIIMVARHCWFAYENEGMGAFFFIFLRGERSVALIYLMALFLLLEETKEAQCVDDLFICWRWKAGSRQQLLPRRKPSGWAKKWVPSCKWREPQPAPIRRKPWPTFRVLLDPCNWAVASVSRQLIGGWSAALVCSPTHLTRVHSKKEIAFFFFLWRSKNKLDEPGRWSVAGIPLDAGIPNAWSTCSGRQWLERSVASWPRNRSAAWLHFWIPVFIFRSLVASRQAGE